MQSNITADEEQLVKDVACALSLEEHFDEGDGLCRCRICGRLAMLHETNKLFYLHMRSGAVRRMEPIDAKELENLRRWNREHANELDT